MRTYQVWMKGKDKAIEIKAEDVNLDSAGDDAAEALFWNFTSGDKDAVTVAGFRYDTVDYFTSIAG